MFWGVPQHGARFRRRTEVTAPKIGELTLENDWFLEGALTKAGLLRRKAMINREHDLAITKQARSLRVRRGMFTIPPPLPPAVPEADLAIMRRLDGCI